MEMSKADLLHQIEVYRGQALAEHELALTWRNRAVKAEAALAEATQNEKGHGMKTQHIIEDLVALILLADKGDAVVDPVEWESHLPQNLPEAKVYVQTACAIIDVLTSGPQQEEILAEMVTLAAGIAVTPDEGEVL